MRSASPMRFEVLEKSGLQFRNLAIPGLTFKPRMVRKIILLVLPTFLEVCFWNITWLSIAEFPGQSFIFSVYSIESVFAVPDTTVDQLCLKFIIGDCASMFSFRRGGLMVTNSELILEDTLILPKYTLLFPFDIIVFLDLFIFFDDVLQVLVILNFFSILWPIDHNL